LARSRDERDERSVAGYEDSRARITKGSRKTVS
jgi:hypothetical protein